MENAKAEMRKAARRTFRTQRRLSADRHQRPGLTAAHILGRTPLPGSRFVNFFRRPIFAAYKAVGGEIDASFLCDVLVARGWRQALPVTVSRDAPLVFRLYKPGDALAPDAAGITAPTADARQVEPDLIIAPLMAFDRTGGRLGKGGGHYDRTIERLRAKKKVFVLGLAYALQEVADVPRQAHDQRLDAILTETGYIEVQRDQDH